MKRQKIEHLTLLEYHTLTKIVDRCKMDCWCLFCTSSSGKDYVFDLEKHSRKAIGSAIRDIASGLDCKENYEYCNLTASEENVWIDLCKRAGVDFMYRRHFVGN